MAAELKYGTKPWFRRNPENKTKFPIQQWEQLIADATGQTLPTANSIQTNIETGITATSEKTGLYLDNLEIRIERK